MNYIGVDCHISSLDFAVVNERGTTTKKAKVDTGVKEFIGFVKSVPKPRRIYIEEGELAGWMLETSLKFGEQLIITDPIPYCKNNRHYCCNLLGIRHSWLRSCPLQFHLRPSVLATQVLLRLYPGPASS